MDEKKKLGDKSRILERLRNRYVTDGSYYLCGMTWNTGCRGYVTNLLCDEVAEADPGLRLGGGEGLCDEPGGALVLVHVRAVHVLVHQQPVHLPTTTRGPRFRVQGSGFRV